MVLRQAEINTESRIRDVCQLRVALEDKPISYYQALYVKTIHNLFSGCKVIEVENQLYLHIDSLSLSDELHLKKVEEIHKIIDNLERDFYYPKSIDRLYLNTYPSDVFCLIVVDELISSEFNLFWVIVVRTWRL